MIRLFKFLVVFVVLGMSACTDSDDDLYSPDQGIYVLNSGSNDWSVSFYQFSTGEVIADYYHGMNSSDLVAGENAVCMAKRRSKAYILTKGFDGSGTIRVVDFIGFKNTSKIGGFNAPSTMAFLNDSVAVVANTGSNPSLSFCDFTKNSITTSIQLKYEPMQLMVKGKYIYVTHPANGLVSVVDHVNQAVEHEIPTLENPTNLVCDVVDDVWVFCQGSGLTKVKHLSWKNVLLREDFPLTGIVSAAKYQIGLSPSGSYVYYFDNMLKRHFINNNILPEKGMIVDEIPTQFGGFNVDSKSGNIYYLQKGSSTDKLLIYQSNGKLLKTLSVGLDAVQTVSYY